MMLFVTPTKENYWKNTFWILFERANRILMSGLSVYFLARYLGVEGYGIYVFVTSYLAIVIAVCTLGIDVLLVKEIRSNKGAAHNIIFQALVLKYLVAIFVVSGAMVINFFLNDNGVQWYIAFSLIGVFFYLFVTCDVLFQASVRSDISSKVQIFITAISVLSKLILIGLEVPSEFLFYFIIIDSLLIGIGYIYLIQATLPNGFSFKIDFRYINSLFKKSIPLATVSISAILYSRLDQIMLKELVGFEELAQYASAVKVVELFYLVPILVAQSLFPKLVDMYQKSSEYFWNSLANAFLVIWVFSGLAAVIVWKFGGLLIAILFGESFTPNELTVGVLGASIIFVSLGALNTKVYYLCNKQVLYAVRSVFGVLLNLMLNLLLIPSFGAFGAAIATLISLACIHLVFEIIDSDLRKLFLCKFQLNRF